MAINIGDAAKVLGRKFKVIKQITHQHIKMENAIEYVFRFDSAIFLGENNSSAGQLLTDAPEKQPPFLADVVQLDEDAEGRIYELRTGQIIVPAILRKELEKHYDGDDIIGHIFGIEPTGKKQRKSGQGEYTTFLVREFSFDDAEPTAVDASEHFDTAHGSRSQGAMAHDPMSLRTPPVSIAPVAPEQHKPSKRKTVD